MRALMLRESGKPENLRLEDVPDPTPKPTEVLVNMETAAVNFPDLLTIEGKYQFRPELPFAPGKEGAGIVSAIGSKVANVNVGDRVMIQVEFGSFAEKALVPEQECYLVPPKVRMEQAAALGIAFQTAYFALVDRALVQPGEKVLITGGSGSVGLAAIQLAKIFECEVIAGLTTPSKAKIVRQNGADHVIDLSGNNLKERIREDVFKYTKGEGVDVVIEIVGGEVFSGSIRCLNFCGRLVVVGFTSGIIPELRTNYLLLKNITVMGLDRGQYRDREPNWMRTVQEKIFEFCVEGKVSMPIQARFKLNEFIKAFDLIRNREIKGKVLLDIK